MQYLQDEDVSRRIHEHNADQQEQQAHEDRVHIVDLGAEEQADEVGGLPAFVADGYHAHHVVVERSREDAADGDGDEGNRPEENSLDGAENRACARDVQQLDEAVAPFSHGHEVDIVAQRRGWCLGIGRFHDAFAYPSVDNTAHHQDDESDDECSQDERLGCEPHIRKTTPHNPA